MRKVTVIGHFGFGFEYLDGQTIKTKIVTSELERQYGEDQVCKIDTHGGVKVLLKAPLQIFRALKSSENVIILPAHNGLRINAPLLALERIFFKSRKIHYIVIGGWLPKFIQKRRMLRRSLESFNGIYVETNTMRRALEEKGFKNIYVMPNCKNLRILDESELVYQKSTPYRLCTFSRVQKEKGIETAIDVISALNNKLGHVAYTLDIYGPIDTNQTQWFEDLRVRMPEYVSYKGSVDSDKSVELLQNYFALLFPTHYYTEGIPGTIIDAYAAGIPVISAKWESFADMVRDGETGIGYEFDDSDSLETTLLNIASDPQKMLGMKVNCIAAAQKYLPKNVIQTLKL